jgi:hypothetical protein
VFAGIKIRKKGEKSLKEKFQSPNEQIPNHEEKDQKRKKPNPKGNSKKGNSKSQRESPRQYQIPKERVVYQFEILSHLKLQVL